jgi:dihydroorotate dehydrogenase
VKLFYDAVARLFRLFPAEVAHEMTIAALQTGLGPVDRHDQEVSLRTTVAGMFLPNCVGLAAGFDKNAQVPDAMLRVGFGFVECGTVTPLPQAGNPRPRLFRLAEDDAVINRMGFNNQGLEHFATRLARRERRGTVGANIGANKDSEDRIGDYVAGLTRLWGAADYFTVNISSPNTPGLRALQTKAALEELLGRLVEARSTLPGAAPVLLKVAPDLDDAQIEAICVAVSAFKLDGIVVGNTTLARPDSLVSDKRGESGGLSGAPLMAPSTEVLRRFRAAAAPGMPLIGVGGIASGADAYAKIRAGACAVQLYSALAFHGPGLVNRIKRDLAGCLRVDGFASVEEAVGA